VGDLCIAKTLVIWLRVETSSSTREDNSGVSISDPDKRHLRLNYDTILKGHHTIDEVKGIFLLWYMRKTLSVLNINLQNSIP